MELCVTYFIITAPKTVKKPACTGTKKSKICHIQSAMGHRGRLEPTLSLRTASLFYK